MKSFFTKVQSIFGDDAGLENVPQKRKMVRGKIISQDDVDDLQNVVLAAAQCLSDALQEILNDISNLSGEKVIGFQRLLLILTSTSYNIDCATIKNSHGVGCLQLLIDNMHHNFFIELCHRVGLASALLSALRLLRMLEIKRSKFGNDLLIDETVDSCNRVCRVFQFLCTDNLTVEQIRSSLVKLFTFPLSVLPKTGLHIQKGSAEIVSVMCRTGFTSQQVWFFHDVQVILHMLHNLQDLIESSDCEEILLRGAAAEQAGMWVDAVRCVVDVIVATMSVSSVLMGDFDSAGGNKIFLLILHNSSNVHFPTVLNLMMRMLFDPLKGNVEDALLVVSYPNIAIILEEFLKGSLSLSTRLELCTVDEFIEICRNVKSISSFQKDYAFQCISYSLLTIYSNEPTYCAVLENQYHLLSLLVLAIPVLDSGDSISAILTTVNYVCQCVETCAPFALTSLCGAAIAVFEATLDVTESNREKFIMRMTLCYSSFEAIVRSSSRYSCDLLKYGLLQHAFCEPFERLCSSFNTPVQVDHFSACAYQKTIALACVLISRNVDAANEIRSSGLCLLITNLVAVKFVSYDFTKYLLGIVYEMSKVNDDHMGDSLETLLSLLLVVDENWIACRCVMDCLFSMSLESTIFGSIFITKGGFIATIGLLRKMNFLLGTSGNDIAYKGFEAVLRFLALQFQLSWLEIESIDSLILSCTEAIIDTQVFASKFSVAAAQLNVDLLNVVDCNLQRSHSPICWMNIVMILLTSVDQLLFNLIVEGLIMYCSSSFSIRRKLNSGGMVSKILIIFPDLFVSGSKINLVNLILVIMRDELTVDGFGAMCTKILRQLISGGVDLKDKLPMPWDGIGLAVNSVNSTWSSLKILLDLSSRHCSDLNEGIPFLQFHSSKSTSIKTDLNGIGKGSGSFTYCCWIRSSSDIDTGGIIPFFSIVSPRSVEPILEVQLDASNGFFRVLASRSGFFSTIRFKPASECDFGKWNHVCVIYRKPKRFASNSKSAISILVNGISCTSSNSELIEMDILQGFEIVVGRLEVFRSLSQNVASGDRVLLRDVRFVTWYLGPAYFFDDGLSHSQIGTMFALGPKYTGTFASDQYLKEHLLCISISLLRYFCESNQSDAYLENLQGIEMLVEPRNENLTRSTIELESLPTPVFLFHTESFSNQVNVDYGSSEILYSSQVDIEVQISLRNVDVYSSGLSFADCVSCLGGPALLFPLCQCAGDEENLCLSLNILKSAIWNNMSNLHFMQNHGYRSLAFILSTKPHSVFTTSVIECLFAIATVSSETVGRGTGILLADSGAFYHLILNFQTWGERRFSLLSCVVKLICSLVVNERHGVLNSKRLSCLGAVKWLLMTSLDEIHRCNETHRREWGLDLPSCMEMAEYRDSPIDFLRDIMQSLQRIIAVEIRRRDLDLVIKSILHTFSSVDSPDIDSGATEHLKYPFCDHSSSTRLTPLSVYRIYLLRLLFSLFDDHVEDIRISNNKRENKKQNPINGIALTELDGLTTFRATLSPTLFLAVLEKASDAATTAHLVRLLGLITQNDVMFLREFCQLDGMRVLSSAVGKTLCIPSFLPIVSIFFRIPMHLFMYTFQIKSVQKFIQILDLDECAGPDVTEPLINDFTLPLLDLLFDCICSYCQCKLGTDECSIHQVATDLLFGIINYGMVRFTSFRQLMQRRSSLSILTSAIVSCSNSRNDFGSAVFKNDCNEEVDLCLHIHDEYLDGSESSRVVLEEKLVDDVQFAFTGDDGVQLFSLLCGVLRNALCEFDNFCCLIHLFALSTRFDKGGLDLQKLIWNGFKNVVKELIANSHSELFTISNSLICLVQCIRCGTVFNDFNFDALSLCLYLMDCSLKLPSHGISNINDRYQRLIKDLGGCSRCFAYAVILQLQTSKSLKGPKAFLAFSTISNALDLLFHPLLEDSLDFLQNNSGRFLSFPIESEKALHGKKSNQAVLVNARNEKNRISSMFLVYLVNSCYGLVLEDDTAVRIEATRILAYLSLNRRLFMEQLLSNTSSNSRVLNALDDDNQSGKEVDIFRDGFAKLVPNSLGKYESYFAVQVDLTENSELSRFADFSYWLSDNNAKCERIFHSIELSLLSFTSFDFDDLLKAFASETGTGVSNPALDAVRRIDRSEDVRKQSELMLSMLSRWNLYGMVHISGGALLWSSLWQSLQCGSIWGYTPLNSKSWCLCRYEGPERSRKKIEQDYSLAAKILRKNDSCLAPQHVEHSEEMESLVRSLAEKGLIKKFSASKLLNNVDIEDSMELLEVADTIDEEFDVGSPSDSVRINKDPEEEDSPSLESLNSSSKRMPRVSQVLDGASKSLILHEIVKGLIGVAEWNKGIVRNVRHIQGLETQISMLVISDSCIHLLRGFVLATEGQSEKKNADRFLQWYPSGSSKVSDDLEDFIKLVWKDLLDSDISYIKMQLSEVYSFFRRRHELKYCALEITDICGQAILFAFDSIIESEEVLLKLFEIELPSSIFNRVLGIKNLQMLRGVGNFYSRLISLFVSSITALWQHGEITNFEYLIHINAAAGRSFQDLTQYPVFPWVISDYRSSCLDLDNPDSFRDLSKPMGALGPRRAAQCKERYQTMHDFYREGVDGSAPPFFYGTHYSCAGYVLHYLLRLQPFTNMSIALQGGVIDKADRLFLSVENSWLSASSENLQDVRELIPEFYYLPNFLVNLNNFDLGITQKGEVVGDVALPQWANNDAIEFIRIHRQALESRYVSENLHHWIDLVFGYKQQGKAALDAMNVFIHLTYEGEVDVDEIDDPILRSATVSQINNFGQCPSKIFSKPHPRKIVPEVVKKLGDLILVDPSAVSWHSHVCPPLTVIGTSQCNILIKLHYGSMSCVCGSGKRSIGDIRLLPRDKIMVCGVGDLFIPPSGKRILRIVSCGISFLLVPAIGVTTRALDGEKDVVHYEKLHEKPITAVKISKTGDLFVTGSKDMSVKVWSIPKGMRKFALMCAFCGHLQTITCVDICSEFSIVLSGCHDGTVCLWDYRSKRLLRILPSHNSSILSVSINHISGNIITLTASELRMFTINGEFVCSFKFNRDVGNTPVPTIAIAVPSSDWQNGVVAVTGHIDGQFYLWKIRNGHKKSLAICGSPTKIHRSAITSLRLCSTLYNIRSRDLVAKCFADTRSLDLLVGDSEGYVSRWSPQKLDQFQSSELVNVLN